MQNCIIETGKMGQHVLNSTIYPLSFKTEGLFDLPCNTDLSHKILACEFDILHKPDLEETISIENVAEISTLSKHGAQLRFFFKEMRGRTPVFHRCCRRI